MPHAIIGFYEKGEKFREELTPDRFQSILRAKETYMLAVDLEEKINLLIDNHHEFELELLKLAEAKRTWPKTEAMDAMEKRLLLDRRIVNLLSACRLYLDQSSHAMSYLFAAESKEFKAANERRHKFYDSNFGYRFMEALRNYVQHRGLLVHYLVYEYHRMPRNTGEYVEFTVKPILELSYLAEDPKFKSSILDEAKAVVGKEVDLRQPIREYVTSIWSLHVAIRDSIARGFVDRFSLYRSVVQQYQQQDGRNILFPRAAEFDESDRTLTETALVTHVFQYYETLCEKNRVAANLSKSYASNYCEAKT